MMVCLSPNGLNCYTDQAPPKQLLVGTIDGVAVLERQATSDEWKRTGQLLKGLHISSLLFDSKRGGLLSGVHGNGLYASKDGGQNWTLKTRGLTQQHVYSLAIQERASGTLLYAGTEPAHLFRSRDYGETWEELPALRSVPGTETWTFPAPPHQGHVKNITFDPRDDRRIFASIEQGGLLKSEDDGQSWRELSAYYKPTDEVYKDVHRTVLRPSNPDVMYISGGEGLYCSSDGGETWEHLTDRSWRIGYPDQLLLSPVDDQVMFLAGASKSPNSWRETHTAESAVARSHDGGRSWKILEPGFPKPMRGSIEAMSIAVWPNGFGFFLGTTDGDVWYSGDEGESWLRIATGLAPVSKVGHYRALQAA